MEETMSDKLDRSWTKDQEKEILYIAYQRILDECVYKEKYQKEENQNRYKQFQRDARKVDQLWKCDGCLTVFWRSENTINHEQRIRELRDEDIDNIPNVTYKETVEIPETKHITATEITTEKRKYFIFYDQTRGDVCETTELSTGLIQAKSNKLMKLKEKKDRMEEVQDENKLKPSKGNSIDAEIKDLGHEMNEEEGYHIKNYCGNTR